VIEAVNLRKTFQDKKRGEVKAVDDVSFVCRPGQIYGLLGANGAGKTTTLRMLATILEPRAERRGSVAMTSSSIRSGCARIADFFPRRRRSIRG